MEEGMEGDGRRGRREEKIHYCVTPTL